MYNTCSYGEIPRTIVSPLPSLFCRIIIFTVIVRVLIVSFFFYSHSHLCVTSLRANVPGTNRFKKKKKIHKLEYIVQNKILQVNCFFGFKVGFYTIKKMHSSMDIDNKELIYILLIFFFAFVFLKKLSFVKKAFV